jgi:Asp-tRNA(Asn)/Glu-tRNA(Gln) amidotransferase A subunit family amidase
MAFDAYESYDALGLAQLVRNGDLKPRELLEAALERVAQRNPALNAVVIPRYEEARRECDDAADGPFRGVPFLVKDLYALIAGTAATSGSRLFAGDVSPRDNELVARYRRAGLVIFGKTASPEFGLTTTTESTLYGQTRNPWKPTHMAGGSSGGSASAVAAGIAPAAHATDGGGSIRVPASCCGLFGMKPTRGRTPYGPDASEGWNGMSAGHAVTRSVRDSAALLDVIDGGEVGAPYAAPPKARPFLSELGASTGRLRIALQTATWNNSPTHADCLAAVRDAAELCRSLGHEVTEAPLEVDREGLARSGQAIVTASTRATIQARLAVLGRELRDDDLEPMTRLYFQAAAGLEAADYVRAIQGIHAAGRTVSRFLTDWDVILSPTMATPPLPLGKLALTNTDLPSYLGALQQSIGFTQLFNASGHPAMSVPLWWNAEGLPIGVQFAGRFGDEATLFRLAAQLEHARPWFDRRPALA